MTRRGQVVRFPKARAAARRSPLEPLLAPFPLFAILSLCLISLHAGVLRLPYFWDEAGYYIPAARELLLHGELVPQFSNAHPPLVMAWLAVAWKIFAFRPLVTRVAMLLLAAFTLTGVYRLARITLGGRPSLRASGAKERHGGTDVAIATVLCTALFPVFFAQSSLAHLDLAAAGFTVWGISFYLEDRLALAVVLFATAGCAKETAILAPLALSAWEMILRAFGGPGIAPARLFSDRPLRRTLALLLALVPLAAWYAYHFHRTGYVFGNPEYVRYNISATLYPARIAVAALTRLWHLLGYMNMFVFTLAALLAMRMAPVREFSGGNGRGGTERAPIPLPVQAVFYVVIAAYVVALSIIGGAALARYLLPVYPLVILLCVSTLRRRLPWWKWFVAVVCLGFVIALLTNPPYRFAPEDNLAYAGYVRLHQAAAQVGEAQYGQRTVLTAWPASDELSEPFLGYVAHPVRVLAIDNFAADQILLARQEAGRYDAVLAFSTKYEPRLPLQLPFWERLQERYFGYHRDLPPEAIAQILGGRLIWLRREAGQWAAIIAIEHAEEAKAAGSEE